VLEDEATQVSNMTENAESFAVDSYLIVVVGRIQCDLHRNRQHGHVGFHNWACQIVKHLRQMKVPCMAWKIFRV